MTIISLKIGRGHSHDYLLRNTTVKTYNPVYVEKGSKLTFVDDLYNKKSALVIDITKTDVLPQSVSNYIEINNDSLEVCGMPITGELRRKLTKQFN